MIEQFLEAGGGLAVIVIAVVLLFREVMRVQAQREAKKKDDDYYKDPETGVRMPLPARNLQLMTELIKSEQEQTKLARKRGIVLERMAATIEKHDAPIRRAAEELEKINGKLMAPEELTQRIRGAVADEMRRAK